MTDHNAMTDEELWSSPLGERLRHYADKLLLAEAERIRITARRQTDGIVAEGLEFGRAVISPLGDPNTMLEDLTGKPTRADIDPWAQWDSPERTGLNEALKATDGTREAAQQAAKEYIAQLQDEEAPAPAPQKEPLTPNDVAGALSYLLTGRHASGTGPFAVHGPDGFYGEPYVLISAEDMARVLNEIPESRW